MAGKTSKEITSSYISTWTLFILNFFLSIKISV